MRFASQFREGARLTTLQLIYRLPDHPSLLQEFLWQADDIPPGFPKIKRFLSYWRREIDAPIHSITVSYLGVIGAGRLSSATWVE